MLFVPFLFLVAALAYDWPSGILYDKSMRPDWKPILCLGTPFLGNERNASGGRRFGTCVIPPSSSGYLCVSFCFGLAFASGLCSGPVSRKRATNRNPENPNELVQKLTVITFSMLQFCSYAAITIPMTSIMNIISVEA